MDTDEPTPITPEVEMEAPIQEDLTPLVMQLLGQKEVELTVARNQIVQLQKQIETLARRLAAKREKT